MGEEIGVSIDKARRFFFSCFFRVASFATRSTFENPLLLQIQREFASLYGHGGASKQKAKAEREKETKKSFDKLPWPAATDLASFAALSLPLPPPKPTHRELFLDASSESMDPLDPLAPIPPGKPPPRPSPTARSGPPASSPSPSPRMPAAASAWRFL